MKANGDFELSDVPRLMREFSDSRNTKWTALLQARAALVDAAGSIVDTVTRDGRGMKAEEQRAFDEHTAQVRDINAALAAYKAAAVAEHGTEIHLPF